MFDDPEEERDMFVTFKHAPVGYLAPLVDTANKTVTVNAALVAWVMPLPQSCAAIHFAGEPKDSLGVIVAHGAEFVIARLRGIPE